MTREEIARLFTEQAQKTYEEWLDLLGHDRAMAKSNVWKDHAAQVDQMRCETCKCDKQIFVDEHMNGRTVWCPWRGCGGCFKHEPKVK